MWGLFGTILGLIGSMIISSRQTSATNRNIQQSLNAQKEENQLNREYNLQLAHTQNEMNIEQWNRENAYNDPSAQMERMRNAGLNPDMMYGGGVSGNVAASSPTLTSGAPSNPMDWSALAGKRSVADSVMQGLQIAQARANVAKTEAEAKNLGNENLVFEKYGLEVAELNKEKVREEIEKLTRESQKLGLSMSEEQLENDFRNAFRDKIIENKLQLLTASTKMSENALKEDIQTLALRIAGVNAENSRLVRMSDFTTDEWRLAFDVIKTLFGALK